MEEKKLICKNCESALQPENDFCPDCGTLFVDEVKCVNHENENAKGVCVICLEPLCSECGAYIHNVFLCKDDSNYEIYEGMTRVFGSNDSLQVEYIKNCLEQSGLHPYVFSRKTSPIYQVSEEYDLHTITELKLMVPFQEVIKAEEIINELDLTEEK
jgi:hypothetical protein